MLKKLENKEKSENSINKQNKHLIQKAIVILQWLSVLSKRC